MSPLHYLLFLIIWWVFTLDLTIRTVESDMGNEYYISSS